jgi:hypothetical protein
MVMTMMMRADLKCYACGYVSGQIEGDDKQSIAKGRVSSQSPLGLPKRRPDGRFGCVRCGGPLYLDDVTYLRPRVRRMFDLPAGTEEPAVAKAS